jgi:methionyl-tRNA formyltransferase
MNLRVAFLGQNSSVTLDLLEAVQAHFNVVALIESAPRGFDLRKYGDGLAAARHRRNSLWRISRRQRLAFFFLTPRNHDDLAAFIRIHSIDVLCISAMSELLKEPALSAARLGAINFHPSLLPLYRGPNPWFWQYYDMDLKGGVSVFFLDAGEDTGDIALQETIQIPLGIPFAELQPIYLQTGGRLFCQTLHAIAQGNCPRRNQRHSICPHRARGITRSEKLIQWGSWTIDRIWHVLRGTLQWLDAVPFPPEAIPGDQWRAGDMIREPAEYEPGSLQRDAQGYFAAHSEGKIRLELTHGNAHQHRSRTQNGGG